MTLTDFNYFQGKYTSKGVERSKDTTEAEEKPMGTMHHFEASHEDECSKANEVIRADIMQAREGPAQADVGNMLESGETPATGVEVEEDLPLNEDMKQQGGRLEVAKPIETSSQQTHRSLKFEPQEELIDTKTISPRLEHPNGRSTPTSHAVLVSAVRSKPANGLTIKLDLRSPMSQSTKTGPLPTPRKGEEGLQGFNSPQIGTTILRRESLRNKGSPRKKGSAQKTRSPHRRHGLKKRDTLQEREILQQFIADASPNEAIGTKESTIQSGNRSPKAKSPDPLVIDEKDVPPVEISSASHQDELSCEGLVEVQAADVVLDTKDLGRAVEAIEVCQDPYGDQQQASVDDASLSSEVKDNIEQANNFIANSEVQQATDTIAEVCDKLDLTIRKTRSGARISDDTSMLQDFLNRAQAKKAAKNVPSLSAEIPKLQSSPVRRSPRKALEPHVVDAVSPQKTKKNSKGPSTPPRKRIAEESDSSDDPETVAGPSTFRRSARTRLPAPSKTPPGAPSFIPVRRGDGSDQVVLQKSQAQEMAIMTRANTRRNKGQSKPPSLALQNLPPESPVKMTAQERADHAKKVAWAERLASYQESRDAPEEPDDQRPKVRRLRGLGAGNGTPAKKSASTVPSSNGTPAPKRRSKTK